ncbi:unnamed protein product [Phytomonas sp. EM1]|nr:unnamed protein product [Phytomonas sp. EM1]|eukprot:CCW60604.1 unnamed protein product [Phytomonas sp. isolate EM1]
MATHRFSKSIVYFGEKYVELNDGEVTLNELCEAFEIPYEPGANLKDRDTGSIIATLPSDIVVSASHSQSHKTDGADVGEVAEFFPQTVETVDVKDGNGSGDENEENQRSDTVGVRLLELCVPVVTDPASVVRGRDGNPSDVVAPRSGANPTALMDDVLLELARLGAVELLLPELPQRLAHLLPYQPQDAPGLLGQIMYPPSVYSPYRNRRDPLDSSPAASHGNTRFRYGLKTPFGVEDSTSDAAWLNHRDGAPYVSALETYEVASCEPGMEAAMLTSRPDLVPFKDAELQRIHPITTE